MSVQKFSLARSTFTLPLIMLLAHCTRADEPEVRVGADCVIPLVQITPGNFEMGRSSRGAFTTAMLSIGDQGDWATEGPIRKVTISKPFLIGKYKVTADQFCTFLNSIDAPKRFVRINTFRISGTIHKRCQVPL